MKLVKLIFTISLVFMAMCAFSQPNFPPGGGEEPCGGPFTPCPVPIDGGVGFLLAAGIAYGGKKLHQRKNSNPSD